MKLIFSGLLFFVFTIYMLPVLSEAALGPKEILVVVNARSADSVRLGKLYIELRHVPAGHLVEVSVPVRDQVSRRDYDASIAAPLRKMIRDLQGRGEKIRCIVTTYGIPLRIGAVRPPGASEAEIKALRKEFKEKKAELDRLKERIKEKGAKHGALVKERQSLQKEVSDFRTKLHRVSGQDTVASVDSELALLLSPPYPLAGPRPNPEFLYARGQVKDGQPVFMVSRLDAPTFALAEGLVRTAMEVEKDGLTGTLYLDARGLKSKKKGYGIFDEDIRKAAQTLKKGRMPVVLDNRPELFGPGDAPSAALYCGWYSLAEYKDAFEWSKGAVGYHVASAEGKSLHDPNKNYWVKRMIEDGVIATLGPVAEPYLSAFPLPSLFFPLLMNGKYTLAEVYAMTHPYLSWRMILIGDPLYTPFKGRPAFDLLNPPPPPR